MAEPIKISTSKYNKQGKVNIDGHIWDIVLPGAGTELRFSQASRACKVQGARIELLGNKIDNGTITEAELDTYEEASSKFEENEKLILDIFRKTFRDQTEDNSEVDKWINDTPTSIILLSFEDVKRQANSEEKDVTTGTPSSS